MKREDLGELHYIALICDVPSMCRLWILSHRAARSVKHGSIALADVQNLRRSVLIPGGGRLHDYANLYICARNPMLFRRKGRHRELAVLRLTPDVLDIDGTIVSDGNAASKYVRFSPSPAGLSRVDYERVFAQYWTHPNDEIDQWRHKSTKCAEILVPGKVGPGFITGAYVSCDEARQTLRQALNASDLKLAITIDGDLFFR